jgi:ABC-type Na+ efflux pump permease subunit
VRHGRGLPPENGSADVLSGMEAWRLARRVVTSLRAFRGFPTTFSFPLLLANSSLVLFDSNHSKFNQNKKLAQLTKRDLNLIMVVRGKMDSTAINHTPFPKRSRRQ